MVTGNPNTLGSFGELPEENNSCRWEIEFHTTMEIIPGLEDVCMVCVGEDDEGRMLWYCALENETNDIDYEEREYERIMWCLRKVKDHVTIEKERFFTRYEEPEPSDY